MIRISISPEAYQAIAASLPKGAKAPAPEPDEFEGVAVWLDRATVAALDRGRRSGESYSDVILRLARIEGR